MEDVLLMRDCMGSPVFIMSDLQNDLFYLLLTPDLL